MARLDAVIFDLDGTLIDSAPDLAHAANRLMEELGLDPFDIDTIRSFIGNGIPKLVDRALTARDQSFDNFEANVARFKEIYSEDPTGKTIVFDNVRETLGALRDAGFTVGLTTNKAEDITRQILPRLALDRFFDVVIGGDTTPMMKPDPLPLLTAIKELKTTKGETVYVGDSHIDAEAAKNAGLDFGFYSGGYNHGDLSDFKVSFEFARFDEFLDKLAASRAGTRW